MTIRKAMNWLVGNNIKFDFTPIYKAWTTTKEDSKGERIKVYTCRFDFAEDERFEFRSCVIDLYHDNVGETLARMIDIIDTEMKEHKYCNCLNGYTHYATGNKCVICKKEMLEPLPF